MSKQISHCTFLYFCCDKLCVCWICEVFLYTGRTIPIVLFQANYRFYFIVYGLIKSNSTGIMRYRCSTFLLYDYSLAPSFPDWKWPILQLNSRKFLSYRLLLRRRLPNHGNFSQSAHKRRGFCRWLNLCRVLWISLHVTYQTRVTVFQCLSGYQNTERRVENTTRSG